MAPGACVGGGRGEDWGWAGAGRAAAPPAASKLLDSVLRRRRALASPCHPSCSLGYRTASTEVNEPLYFLMVQERMDTLG